MRNNVNEQTDLIVATFKHVAKKVPVESLHLEVEKYHATLRLIQRDVFGQTADALKAKTISVAEHDATRRHVAIVVDKARNALLQAMQQYTPHAMAA